MKQIVWVFGTSGAGKETFIRNVYNSPELQKRFGWSSDSLAICGSSLKNIGQTENDPIVKLREKILSEAARLLESVDTVLIKWQGVDSETSRPERLKKLLPQAHHKAIELRAPKDELIIRLAKKKWWHDYGRESEFIEKELRLVRSDLKELGKDFERIILDSSNKSKYTMMSPTNK